MEARDEPKGETLNELFTDPVEKYSDLAYRVAFRMLRDVEDAEDTVQEDSHVPGSAQVQRPVQAPLLALPQRSQRLLDENPQRQAPRQVSD